ncbi:CPBP family intramembrane glutamic endopeptidase [uncultured Dokdonia sp.]|uniref:CPBP family intramembrane glutamic endopeptidase n=1 Tax=uncultured Dokdonia sp. TaxID=575653 RepID=UPI00260FFC9A|nr:CPBP family intramembrane glutamic endopeptidase [uncultured Dokdonia sp.]
MKAKISLIPLYIFVILLILIIVSREWTTNLLIGQGITSYRSHTLFSTGVNVLMSLIAYLFIKKYHLQTLAGIHTEKVQHQWLLLYPLYLILINVLFMDEMVTDNLLMNSILLLIYCISIGYSEELSLRGFMQSYLIKAYGHSKKGIVFSVFGAGFIFGLLHLLKFDKGIYGEVSQVFFALFIGVLFGALLLRTKRLYPLIIIHALIDFFAKLDSMGISETTTEATKQATSLTSAIVITLVVLPCLIFGMIMLRKVTVEEVQ